MTYQMPPQSHYVPPQSRRPWALMAALAVCVVVVVVLAMWLSNRSQVNVAAATTPVAGPSSVQPGLPIDPTGDEGASPLPSASTAAQSASGASSAANSGTTGTGASSSQGAGKPSASPSAGAGGGGAIGTGGIHGPKVTVTRAFYLDCTAGSDSAAGTSPAQAWRTLAKASARTWQAGDGLRLKRGCSWDGGLDLNGGGTASKPTVVQPYGTGAAPLLSNTKGAYYGNVVRVNGHDFVVEGLRMTKGKRAGIETNQGSANTIIRNIEVFKSGFGVYLRGANHKVFDSYVHDLNIVVNTPGGNDDNGAVCYNVEGANMEIAYNRGINCIAPSYDYGKDGGFVEVWQSGDNLHVHHNYAKNTCGFFELGSRGGRAHNIRVDHNVIVNTGTAVYPNPAGTEYSIDIKGMRFEYNTMVQRVSPHQQLGGTQIAFERFGSSAAVVRNNIFSLSGGFTAYGGQAASIPRNNNFYHLVGGSINGAAGAGSKQGDPRFMNANTGNYRLRAGSPAKGMGAY